MKLGERKSSLHMRQIINIIPFSVAAKMKFGGGLINIWTLVYLLKGSCVFSVPDITYEQSGTLCIEVFN